MIGLDKLVINRETKRKDTLTRTIRFSGNTYDKIYELATKNRISFNNVTNQLVEYALQNVIDEESKNNTKKQ